MQVHILSFEGPDPYSRAGGIASRVSGLAQALGRTEHDTHLWFVGDPDAPGHEDVEGLHLHRWSQWISAHFRGGVYEGEEQKWPDFASALPPFLLERHLRPHLAAGGRAVVLAEEWQTVHAVLHLDWLLARAGLRDRVRILWNANNTFGFDRIDFTRLGRAATITTVSRYMKHLMWAHGTDPVVIPNGLPPEAFLRPDSRDVWALRKKLKGRVAITKVARFDPDKRWMLAVDIVSELKRQGRAPVLIARGGVEAHGAEVLSRAAAQGLSIVEREATEPGPGGLVRALDRIADADVILLRRHLDADARATLFRASNAVLANSGREPFGLVGLEAMAVGGLACTGCTGEDYAVSGRNALVLQSTDPLEFVGLFASLSAEPGRERAVRRAGEATAREYAWSNVIERSLLPRVALAAS